MTVRIDALIAIVMCILYTGREYVYSCNFNRLLFSLLVSTGSDSGLHKGDS